MKHKTNVDAPDGKHDLVITREFDLPLEVLFQAYVEPEIVEQWIGAKVLKLESRKYGNYLLEVSDAKGNTIFQAHGVIHEFSPNRKITRTFEMTTMSLGVQLEIYEFEKLTDTTSKLTMHVIYESAEQRDELLKFQFVPGINNAHNRLQKFAGKHHAK